MRGVGISSLVPSLRRHRKLFIGIVLLLIGGIYAACAQSRIGEFDWERYRALTPEKRQQYDLLFFNEMETWNMNSSRYGLDSFGQKREQEFRRMAADGYLPAYVAVRIFVFEEGNVIPDKKAYDMLLRAAEQGSGSERCALFPIRWLARAWGKDKSFLENVDETQLDRLYQLGVEQGHFGCQYLYGISYELGQSGFPKDLVLAKKFLLQAAAQGYFRAQRGLALFYRERGITNVRDAEKLLCWSALADQHRAGTSFSSGLHAVEDAARLEDSPIRDPHIKEELESLRSDWAPIGGVMIPKKNPTASECLTLEQKAN